MSVSVDMEDEGIRITISGALSGEASEVLDTTEAAKLWHSLSSALLLGAQAQLGEWAELVAKSINDACDEATARIQQAKGN